MGATGLRRPLPLLLTAGALAVCALYLLFDPAQTWWMPKCPMHFLTGLDCPGCGSQRALHALLHGDLRGAWEANAFLTVIIPTTAVTGYAELTRQRNPRLYRAVTSPAAIYGILGLTIAWTVARNLW